MGAPYWSDDRVTLYLGDCREVTDWLAADALVTDPPYGIGWAPWCLSTGEVAKHRSIDGDADLAARDEIIAAWGNRSAIAFGDLKQRMPEGTRQILIYEKPPLSGVRGTTAGFRRDAEAVYLIGPWTTGVGGRSSILRTGARTVSNPSGLAARHGHPHAKPVDVMETLIAACPPGVIADPFAGSGSTLIAARNQNRKAVGVEIDERYCEMAARRLAQTDLFAEVNG
jgi:site-specific DNA-methyltransferase (adenine-specific)